MTTGAREALVLAARDELVERGDASISLRAVARRAGLSHAAPTHFFADRAGLLTAVATEGFVELTAALERVGDGSSASLRELGHAYVDYGLAHPALFDLMFRPSELDLTSTTLRTAQDASIGVLLRAVDTGDAADSTERALTAWAFVHGLVVLTRDGALAGAVPSAPHDPIDQAHRLVDLFARAMGDPTTDRPTGE